MLTSKVLSESDLTAPWFLEELAALRKFCNESGWTERYRHKPDDGFEPPHHRKTWEWCYIIRALRERGKLQPGMTGIGFGVGVEPLPDYFRSLGCFILATDAPVDDKVHAEWVNTGQHNANVMPVDMKHVPWEFSGNFDFCWSTSSMEHLGSLDEGISFWYSAKHCLRPGGVNVHVTEYNLTSRLDTIEVGSTVIFRRQEIYKMVASFDDAYTPWSRPLPRPAEDGKYYEPHLRLQLGDFVLTSAGLINQLDE